MALIHYRIVGLFLFLSLMPATVFAEPQGQYTFNSNLCAVFRKEGTQWAREKSESFPAGKTVQAIGSSSTKSGEVYIYFTQDGRHYSAKKSCFSNSPTTYEATTRARDATSSWLVSLSISYLHWQESLTLTGPDGTSNPLKAKNSGPCPGIELRRPLNQRWAFDTESCILLASSEVTQTSTSGNPNLTYGSSGTHAQGFAVSPGLLWTAPFSEHFRVGVDLPVILRITNWPATSGGDTLSSTSSAVVAGLWFESQFDLGSVLIAPKAGFISSTSNFAWSIEAGYHLF